MTFIYQVEAFSGKRGGTDSAQASQTYRARNLKKFFNGHALSSVNSVPSTKNTLRIQWSLVQETFFNTPIPLLVRRNKPSRNYHSSVLLLEMTSHPLLLFPRLGSLLYDCLPLYCRPTPQPYPPSQFWKNGGLLNRKTILGRHQQRTKRSLRIRRSVSFGFGPIPW